MSAKAGEAPSIDVKNLTFAFPDGSTGLQNVILNLPPSSRTLLIGGVLCYPLHSSPANSYVDLP